MGGCVVVATDRGPPGFLFGSYWSLDCRLKPMPVYCVEVPGLPPLSVSCVGCSGDALQLALREQGLANFRVERRSKDGRQWWFQVNFKPGSIDPATTEELTRLVSVDLIED